MSRLILIAALFVAGCDGRVAEVPDGGDSGVCGPATCPREPSCVEPEVVVTCGDLFAVDDGGRRWMHLAVCGDAWSVLCCPPGEPCGPSMEPDAYGKTVAVVPECSRTSTRGVCVGAGGADPECVVVACDGVVHRGYALEP